MSDINAQIDAAVAAMKARAAQFNETKTMDPEQCADPIEVTFQGLTQNAYHNLAEAIYGDLTLLEQHLLDAMNLCALALSVLPAESQP
jgi:hypothetical protein